MSTTRTTLALLLMAFLFTTITYAQTTASNTLIEGDTVTTQFLNTTVLNVSQIDIASANAIKFSNNRLTNAANPQNCQDAATKNYVDKVINESIDPTC